MRAAGLQGRLLDRKSGRWQIKTDEAYRNGPPSLVTVHHLAGPRQARPQFGRLAGLAGPALEVSRTPDVQRALERRAKRAERTRDPVDLFSLFQLQATVASRSELPSTAEEIHAGLVDMRLEGDGSVRVFANAGVHVIQRAEELSLRARLASVLLRVEYDDQLRSDDARAVGHARQALRAGGLIFSSSEKLYDGIKFLDPYVVVLRGSLSPAVWSLMATRDLGPLMFSLGRPLAGTKGDAAEMLHLMSVPGATEPVRTPEVSATACSEAVEWWTAQLNEFFGVLTDPAVFSDRTGAYVPVKHTQALLTAEQLFRRVVSIQASHRDANARRVLLYSVLDTLSRLVGRDIDTHSTLSFAEKTLGHLRTVIPPAAAEILLPAAERAVKALKDVQNGFYMLRHFGADELEIADTAGVTRLTKEKAAAEYIKLLRNATHGHGTNRSGRVALTNALLAHHDGSIPDDLPLLGYLYLLDVLVRPDVVRRTLYASGRR